MIHRGMGSVVHGAGGNLGQSRSSENWAEIAKGAGKRLRENSPVASTKQGDEMTEPAEANPGYQFLVVKSAEGRRSPGNQNVTQAEYDHARDTIRALIEASSLGAPEAQAARLTISDEWAAEIVARSVNHGQPEPDASEIT